MSFIKHISNNQEYIHLTDEYNPNIHQLPPCKGLVFDDNFNQPINNLPDIQEICLNYQFNQPIDFLPTNLKTLTIKGRFNQTLNNLPPYLESLIIDGDFNQPLINLPQGLKFLQIAGYFNNNIVLPEGIECICFSNTFNKPFNIPSSLKYLSLGRYFNQIITELPDNLELSCNMDINFLKNLRTDNLKKIYLKKFEFLNDFVKVNLSFIKDIKCDLELIIGDNIYKFKEPALTSPFLHSFSL